MRWAQRAHHSRTAILPFLGFLLLSGTPIFAQTPASSRELSPAELEAQQALETQKKSQKALADFLRTDKGQTRSANGLNSLFYQFRMAIPKFRTATDEF